MSLPQTDANHWLFDRRRLLRWTAASLTALPLSCQPKSRAPTSAEALREEMLRFPGKIPMRVINHRPPCLETPWSAFSKDLTPNEAFFVRWHLQVLPTTVDVRTWRLKVHGEVEKPQELSLTDLKAMKATRIAAVCQCSGNSRSFFEPHVPGAQWRNGGMGNARWTGVALRDVLALARPRAKAVDVTFSSLDRGGPPGVPDFTKSLSMDQIAQTEPLLAYEMNDQPLPLLNGFPLRLVLPGWYATYWVKALSALEVLPDRFKDPFRSYWMTTAYRIPTAPNGLEDPKDLSKSLIPIHRMNVRSFFTSPGNHDRVPFGKPIPLEGIAFDGGDGIKQVQVSPDDGATWLDAQLDDDLGKFSFRRWHCSWQPMQPGDFALQVRAISGSGEKQPATAGWNRSGFMRNAIETISVTVASKDA
jgi:sulfite dehydrogenase (cytochrome) subunit A